MTAADTSVLVAAFASWHEGHESAREALRPGTRLLAHVAVETYAVLTRLPSPHRAEGSVVAEFLRTRFTEPPVGLEAAEYLRLVEQAPHREIVGGAVYDAVIGTTAAATGHTLLTRDRRATRTYQAVGARFEFVG